MSVVRPLGGVSFCPVVREASPVREIVANPKGEGIVGLTRGLIYADAARVALSLWQVDDKGTSVLMQEFYKQMLEENKTPIQALRAAHRKLWSNPDWRNPYYWAAFTLQGEWK